MKKAIMFFIIVFLVSCETSEEPLTSQEEPVLLPEEQEDNGVTDVIVNDEQDEVETESPEEEIIEVVLESQIFEELFKELWFSEDNGNYVSFRILGHQDIRLYFRSDHEIQVTVDLNVRDDQQFLIYEAVEAAGQFLSKYPIGFIQKIDELLIVGTNSSLVLNGSRATIGSIYLLRSFDNLRLIQGFSFPLIKSDLNSQLFDPTLWNQVLSPLDSYQDFHKLDSSLQLKEIYFAYLLDEAKLLPEPYMSDFEPYIVSFSNTYLQADEFLLTSTVYPQLPNNMTLNIQMGEFYDVIPDDAPSSFMSLSYNGIETRYYEKIVLPLGCYSPPQCPKEAEEYSNFPWQVHQYTATFSDGQPIEFNVPSDTDLERAEYIATEFALAFGRVVGVLRTGVQGVLVINGRGNAWGGPYHGYGTQLTNCGECDVFKWDKLEELIMHELVHSTIDYRAQWYDHKTGEIDRSGQGLITLEEWNEQAVQKDGFSMDQRSIDIPLEDKAQTMLFYAALRFYPDSTSDLTKRVIEQLIPNRIAKFDELLGLN